MLIISLADRFSVLPRTIENLSLPEFVELLAYCKVHAREI